MRSHEPLHDDDHSSPLPEVSPERGGRDGAHLPLAASPTQQKEQEQRGPSFWNECRAKCDVTLLLSVLIVASWGLAGNACRFSLHGRFQSIPFLNTYSYFGPNCVGSFAISFFGALLPKESKMPLVTRAISVGFCGTFTTFSSWVVDVVNQNSASGAFAELISGLTMPFVFCLIGRDAGLLFHRWLAALVRHVEHPTPEEAGRDSEDCNTDILKRRHKKIYVTVDYLFLVLSICAAVVVPIAVQVRINQSHIDTITSTQIKAVVVAPAGTVVRFLLSYFLNKRKPWGMFPAGTLLANVIASFLDAFMDNYASHRPWNEWFWIVENGICGALSTKSSFVNEINNFYAERRLLMAYLYALITVALTITTGAIGRRGNYE